MMFLNKYVLIIKLSNYLIRFSPTWSEWKLFRFGKLYGNYFELLLIYVTCDLYSVFNSSFGRGGVELELTPL